MGKSGGGTTDHIITLRPASALQSLKAALLLPEVTDARLWRDGQLYWADKEQQYTFIFSGWVTNIVTVNSNYARPEEISSYRDLLKPKWKGKIVIDDPTVTGMGSKNIGFLGDVAVGWDFIRELAKQEPVVLRDLRLAMDGLARGKYAIGIGMKPEIVTEFRNAGVPLEYVTKIKEGTYLASGSGAISFLSRPAHPNAAKVYINWLLSKEGQKAFVEGYGVPSRRLDVSIEGLDPSILPRPGMKYMTTDDEDYMSKRQRQMELAKEIFMSGK